MTKFLWALTLCLVSTSLFAADQNLPEGRYACKIAFKELTNTQIAPGADFPTGSNLDVPLERKETLVLDFSVGENPGVVVINPEALPNWLLINSDQATNQNSFVYPDSETDGLVYTVDWPQTWYFGSRVQVTPVSAPKNGKMSVNLLLDDNDGWSIELKFVSCRK